MWRGISLANKCLLLFGAAVILIIVAALSVPWLRMNSIVDEGQYDAIVLASAGLRRLGWEARISQYFGPSEICPAVGQGALAIETPEGKRGIVAKLHNVAAGICVRAERALLGALGGGCQVPVGAYAHLDGEVLALQAIVASTNGARIVRSSLSGDAHSPEELGRRVADQLLEQGARELLAA